MALRPNEVGETFKLVGFTYVNGIMHQELLQHSNLKLPERDFVLT
jgi:hypothetical protein